MTKTVIGIDLGGTKIDVARFAEDWTIEARQRETTAAKHSFETVYKDVLQMIKSLQQSDTAAVGIGLPGLIRQPDGVITTLPNIPGAEGFALKQKLEAELSLPVFVDNDANCFTLASASRGLAADYDVVAGIIVGTGVGGGIVIHKKIFHGNHGFAGEFGHMLLQPGQPPFTTDNKRGEVEQFFSGTAMGKRCQEASDPSEYLEGQVCSFMHKDIYKEIAWLSTNIIHAIDPGIIIFGGTAGRALAPHLEQIKAELTQWLLPTTPVPELAIATVENAEVLGAGLLTQS